MIKRYLWSGTYRLLPLLITFYLIKLVGGWLTSLYQEPVSSVFSTLGYTRLSDLEIFLLSVLCTFLTILFTGLLVSNFIGRQLFRWIEIVILKIPVVKSVYSSINRLTAAIQNPDKAVFSEVVLIEFPSEGNQTLGFITHKDCSWISPQGVEWYSVFIPTSPNPSNGYVLMLPKDKIKATSIAPDEALSWIVSGGAIVPHGPRQ